MLGSATPSLESMWNARSGKYALLKLGKRVDDRPLPVMRIIDMKREVMRAKGPVLISGNWKPRCATGWKRVSSRSCSSTGAAMRAP